VYRMPEDGPTLSLEERVKRFILSIVLVAAWLPQPCPRPNRAAGHRDSRGQTRSGIGDDSGGSRRE
jgi:hypothetical protein